MLYKTKTDASPLLIFPAPKIEKLRISKVKSKEL
jgi:hypothetical protein